MKANKALKRLTKIKALLSDVTRRYSANAPNLRDVLQYAEDAVTRAKEAVGLEVSSSSKRHPKVARSAKKAAPAKKKNAVKKVVNAPRARTAKKTPPAEKQAKKGSLKKAAPVKAVATKGAQQSYQAAETA